MDREVAIQRMGLSPKSSTGKRSLAALLAFRLWEKQGTGQVKQSELGRRIGAAPDPQVHAVRELKEAALSPTVHARIYENWPEGLPQEDQGLVAWLRMDANFHPEAAGPVIEEVRRSFGYARVYEGARITPPTPFGTDQDDDEDDGEDGTPVTSTTEPNPGAMSANLRVSAGPATTAISGIVTPRAGPHVSFTLAGDNRLEVTLRSRVSRREFEKIKKIIELAEDSFVEPDAAP